MKLKRGQKLCNNCNNINGARARTCKHCNNEFEIRGDVLKKIHKKRKNKNFSTVDWKSLNRGDIIYVNGRSGNYFLNSDGTRTYTTDKGVYTVIDIKDEGLFAYGKRGNTFIYMGEEKQSKHLSTMFQSPHKIYIKKMPESHQVI